MTLPCLPGGWKTPGDMPGPEAEVEVVEVVVVGCPAGSKTMPVGVAVVEAAATVVQVTGVLVVMSTVSRAPVPVPVPNSRAVMTATPTPVVDVLAHAARLGSIAIAMGCWSMPREFTVGVVVDEVIEVRSMAVMLFVPVPGLDTKVAVSILTIEAVPEPLLATTA